MLESLLYVLFSVACLVTGSRLVSRWRLADGVGLWLDDLAAILSFLPAVGILVSACYMANSRNGKDTAETIQFFFVSPGSEYAVQG